MNFAKNVPGLERGLRVGLGLLATAGGIAWASAGNPWLGIVVAASGLGIAMTGMVGWCPLCAMVGRKLPEGKRVVVIQKLGGKLGASVHETNLTLQA